MGGTSVTALDGLAPVPEFSVLELAVVICCARRPGSDLASVASEIGQWFNTRLVESDLAGPLRRLLHCKWLLSDCGGFSATEVSHAKAESAALGLIHFLFRDRFFVDVGKLLDATIVREDLIRDL